MTQAVTVEAPVCLLNGHECHQGHVFNREQACGLLSVVSVAQKCYLPGNMSFNLGIPLDMLDTHTERG